MVMFNFNYVEHINVRPVLTGYTGRKRQVAVLRADATRITLVREIGQCG